MYFVYAIKSKHRNYLYVGITHDLERRLKDHSSGYNRTTKAYAPFDTILIEEYNSRSDARAREKYLKSGVGKEFLKKLLQNK